MSMDGCLVASAHPSSVSLHVKLLAPSLSRVAWHPSVMNRQQLLLD